MNPEASRYFRDQLRDARAAALRDAEGFQSILFAMERLGIKLSGEVGTLKTYQSSILAKAKQSFLAQDIPRKHRGWHTPFSGLYEVVLTARNDALHQGAFARSLTKHTIELSLVLEDALMSNSTTVSDYMVRDPVCAFPWQPISFIRQQMLVNSFSYLPVRLARDEKPAWFLISDHDVAQYIRVRQTERNKRFAKTLEQALDDEVYLVKAILCTPATSTEAALQKFKESEGRPLLVCHDGHREQLLGILTAFNLL